jgi:hypothetical protein
MDCCVFVAVNRPRNPHALFGFVLGDLAFRGFEEPERHGGFGGEDLLESHFRCSLNSVVAVPTYARIAPLSTPKVRMTEKKLGRPPGKTNPVHLHMRVEPDFYAEIDEWRRQEPDLPNRADAIRRLIKLGLTVRWRPKP